MLVGNGKAATIGIFAFIVVLCLCFARCHAAEIDLEGGSSVPATRDMAQVLGLNAGSKRCPQTLALYRHSQAPICRGSTTYLRTDHLPATGTGT